LKSFLSKTSIISLSVLYLLQPLSHEIGDILHSFVHLLETTSSNFGHSHLHSDEHFHFEHDFEFSEHELHDHKLLNMLVDLMEGSVEHDHDMPSTTKQKVDKHIGNRITFVKPLFYEESLIDKEFSSVNKNIRDGFLKLIDHPPQ